MRIAYVALRGVPLSDGIAQLTDDMARRMVARGHDVTVYTSRKYGNKNGVYDNSYNILTVPSIKVKAFEKLSLIFFASVAQMFHKYDIVHFHGESGAICSCLARWTGKATIAQNHGIDSQRSSYGKFGKCVLRMLEDLSVKSRGTLLVCCNELQRYFKNTYGKESVVIHNAVEVPAITEVNTDLLKTLGLENQSYYLFMARISREKGVQYMINAYNRLHTNKKLVIAGPFDVNNPYHQELKQLANGNTNIVFAGFAKGEMKEQLFRGAYAFCLPSELEGFSVGLLEAMSYGKCCIVSDIPNNLEATSDACFSFKTKDENTLLEAFEKAEKNPELVATLGQKARQRVVQNFSWDITVEKMEELYLREIQKRHKRN